MHTRFANGAHYGAYAPLGYVKDPDKKGNLLIDPETRWIVEKIFDLAVHGRGAASITRILVEEKVPTPGWLNYERYGTFANIYAGAPAEKAYAWTITQVKSILKEETYIGHSVHNKQSNISFKNKKKVRKPQEEWYRVKIPTKPSFQKCSMHYIRYDVLYAYVLARLQYWSMQVQKTRTSCETAPQCQRQGKKLCEEKAGCGAEKGREA